MTHPPTALDMAEAIRANVLRRHPTVAAGRKTNEQRPKNGRRRLVTVPVPGADGGQK